MIHMPCYSWHPVEAARLSQLFYTNIPLLPLPQKSNGEAPPFEGDSLRGSACNFYPKMFARNPLPFRLEEVMIWKLLLRNAGFVRGMEYFGGGSNCKTVGGDFNIYCSFPCSCWGKVPLDEHIFASPKHQG